MFKKLATTIKNLLSKVKKSKIVKDNAALAQVVDQVSDNIDTVAAVADKSVEEIKAKVEEEVAEVTAEVKKAKKPGRPKKEAAPQASAVKKAAPKKPAQKKK